MGSYVIRVKVLPDDPGTDHEKIVESVTASLPKTASVRAHRIEPIAFGLSAIIFDIVAPEEEGTVDAVEKSLSTAPLVSQADVTGVSRMSSRLPPQ